MINVGMARFELATSWSQTRRDNRATLHPERVKTLYEFIGSTHTNNFKRCLLRREWDSNPRYSLTRTTI